MTRLLVPALVVVLLATGCDLIGSAQAPLTQTSPQPLSRARFVHIADRACATAMHEMKSFEPPTSFDTADTEISSFQLALTRMITVIRGLTPPSSLAAADRRFLATATAEEVNVANFVDAFEAHDVARVDSLAKRIPRVGKVFNTRAKKLGLKVCAKK